MSTYLKGANDVKDHERGQPAINSGFPEAFPEISAIFSGDFNSETGFWRIPPASLTLFAEGGRLKFVINPRGFGQVCFGTLTDAREGLEGVQRAIREGHCEWKARGGQKRS